jgi:single-strand DNA-binding protein
MAGSVNKVTLIGNLGKDPEIRNTQAGMKIVNLTVATSDTWNDKASGERQDRTEWHRVVIMNDRLAETAERFLRKGSKVYLEGKLQTRKWTDQSGQDKYTTEVMLGRFGAELVLLDRPGDGGAAAPSTGGERAYASRTTEKPASRAPASGGGWDSGGGRGGDIDDEIPF